jgi:hypothetical protein
MARLKIALAVSAIVLLSLGGLVSLYQAMFDIWMTAYPFTVTGHDFSRAKQATGRDRALAPARSVFSYLQFSSG